MMLDAQNVFTYTASGALETQALTNTAEVSYRALDLGANQTYANGVDGATPVCALGNGQPVFLITQITVNAGGGTSPSLNIKLVAATDIDFTSSRIITQTGAIAAALIPVGKLIVQPVPPTLGYRFWRVEYALNNNDNDFTVKSFLADMAPAPYMHLGPAYLA